jgi:multidrug efflux pump subunit AcrA (membrane-fusion protein)
LANVEKVNVQVKLAQEEYDRQEQLFEKKVVAQAALDIATRNIDAAKQGLAAAQAAAENARLAYESEIGGVNTTVVLDAIATGQFQATGVLQDMGADVPGGRAVAIINITDDTSSYNLPGGSAAQVALYTPYARHFAIIRRILLRMRSWENYVFLEGH